jgi:hypothetical protein
VVTFRTLFYPPQGHAYKASPVDFAMLAYAQDGEAPMGWNGVQSRLAALSYTAEPIGDWTGPGTQGYVARNEAQAVLAFRGTEPNDWADLFTSLTLLPATESGAAKVHEGFQKALTEVWPQVEAKLPLNLPLTICGHSLGGALALLSGAKLSARTPRVYTYGTPRVGNKEWGQRLLAATNKQVFRYVNEEDIIASVPARRLGYAHAPAKVTRLREASVTEDTEDLGVSAIELAAAITELALWTAHRDISKPVTQPRLAAHSPSHYLRRSPM